MGINKITECSMDLLADIMPAVARLFADRPLLVALLRGNKAEVIRIMTADHKEDTVSLIARIRGIASEDYEASPVRIFADLMEILSNKELTDFFSAWGRPVKTSPGAVSQNTEAAEPTSSASTSKAAGTSGKRKSKNSQNV